MDNDRVYSVSVFILNNLTFWDEIPTEVTFKAHRWVVEANHSWFNRFHTQRYEKTTVSYLAYVGRCHDHTQQGHGYLWISPLDSEMSMTSSFWANSLAFGRRVV